MLIKVTMEFVTEVDECDDEEYAGLIAMDRAHQEGQYDWEILDRPEFLPGAIQNYKAFEPAYMLDRIFHITQFRKQYDASLHFALCYLEAKLEHFRAWDFITPNN